jgi:hypothetical protein
MNMNKILITLITVIVSSGFSPVYAKVQPSPVNQDSSVSWSKVTKDAFEGKIVYDKDFEEFGGNAIVSSWSPQAIRLTYFRQEREIDYYRQVQKTRTVRRNNKDQQETYWESEPVYKYNTYTKTPESMMFSIKGEIYTYEGGKVSESLASALANAPNENMTIRLVWEDGSTTDTTIGSGTVRAWKEIYQLRIEN